MTHKLVEWDRERVVKSITKLSKGQAKPDVTFGLKIVEPPKRGKIRIKKKGTKHGRN